MVYYLYSSAEESWFEFEFDEAKSRANAAKHGIDFIQAQGVWLDPDRWEVPARREAEERFLMIGSITGRHWTVVVTYRSETIRIISGRRSRREEVRTHGHRGVR